MKNNKSKGDVKMRSFFTRKEQIEEYITIDELNEKVGNFMDELIPKSIRKAAEINRINDEYWNNWER